MHDTMTAIRRPTTFSAPGDEFTVRDAEKLSNDLKKLLARYKNMVDEEGVRREVKALSLWVDDFRRGRTAAYDLPENDCGWYADLCGRLKLAADEITRLEGEGGPPPPREQAEKSEQLLETARRIEKLLNGKLTC